MNHKAHKTVLNTEEQAVLARIVDYGMQHKYSSEDIGIAAKVSWIESTLGKNLTNNDGPHNNTAIGLFQFTQPTWKDRHAALGDRSKLITKSLRFTRIYQLTTRPMKNTRKSISTAN